MMVMGRQGRVSAEVRTRAPEGDTRPEETEAPRPADPHVRGPPTSCPV